MALGEKFCEETIAKLQIIIDEENNYEWIKSVYSLVSSGIKSKWFNLNVWTKAV